MANLVNDNSDNWDIENEKLTNIAISTARYYQNPLPEICKLWSESTESNDLLRFNFNNKLQKMITNKEKVLFKFEIELRKMVSKLGIDVDEVVKNISYTSTVPNGHGSWMMNNESYLIKNQLKFILYFAPGLEIAKIDLLHSNNIHVNKDIKNLVNKVKPFKEEVRTKINDIFNKNNEFLYLINETPSNFFIGKIIIVKIIKINTDNEILYCRYNNQIDIKLSIKSMLESHSKKEDLINKALIVGNDLNVRIVDIDLDSLKVEVTAKDEDLSNHKNEEYLKSLLVNYKTPSNYTVEDSSGKELSSFIPFEILPEDYINKKYIEEFQLNGYIGRNIDHPYFRNISLVKCIDYLKDKPIGQFLFRPSYLGYGYLTLTWKVYNNIYSHKDIIEEDRSLNSPIENKLSLEKESYYSLQEIINKYICPCIEYVKSVIVHRRFERFSEYKQIEDTLKLRKEDDKKIIHYLLTMLEKYHQCIIIAYIPTNVVKMELIYLSSKGYYFHDQQFYDINAIINYFKDYYGGREYEDYAFNNSISNQTFLNRELLERGIYDQPEEEKENQKIVMEEKKVNENPMEVDKK